MAKAKKLPSGSWRVLVYSHTDENGKRKYESFTASTKKEAEYLASQFAAGKGGKKTANNITLGEAIESYIDSKSNILSPSTIRGYQIIKRNALPDLIAVPVSELESGVLIQKQINANAVKYAAKSIRNQIGLISAALKHVHIPCPEIAAPPKKPAQVCVPPIDDIRRIMAVLEGSEIECQVLLALTCSLRQSEIAALTAEDVKGQYIYVHGARVPDENNELVYKPTAKSEAGTRTILMPDRLSALMNERCKEKPNGWLFDTTPFMLLDKFKKLLRENNIKPYTIHALRHGFAAIMHAQGVPDKYVLEMGGWSSDHVLRSVYQYTFESEVDAAKKRVNSFFDTMTDSDSKDM